MNEGKHKQRNVEFALYSKLLSCTGRWQDRMEEQRESKNKGRVEREILLLPLGYKLENLVLFAYNFGVSPFFN